MNYKYNTYWLLHSLPSWQMDFAKKWLARRCGVSLRTFERWMYAKEDNPLEVAFSNLLVIADFFDVPVEKMINHKEEGNKEAFVQYLKTIPNVHIQDKPE